jgi:hypothetical protein
MLAPPVATDVVSPAPDVLVADAGRAEPLTACRTVSSVDHLLSTSP